MPVYQVDEYYIYMSGLNLSDEKKAEIYHHLLRNRYSEYAFEENDTVLIVDGIDIKRDGERIEKEILEIISS